IRSGAGWSKAAELTGVDGKTPRRFWRRGVRPSRPKIVEALTAARRRSKWLSHSNHRGKNHADSYVRSHLGRKPAAGQRQNEGGGRSLRGAVHVRLSLRERPGHQPGRAARGGARRLLLDGLVQHF